jgi:hypothetical protein
LATVIAVGGALPAQQPQTGRIVFNGGTDVGEVWANVALTASRLDEDYLPMIVAVVNHHPVSVRLDRDSFRLIGPDGVRYPMPTLKELRRRYSRQPLDLRAASAAGIPWEVWLRNRRLVDADFFPELSTGRRAIVIDEVTLAENHAMVDLLYFAKPPGLGVGTPFILEVQPLGWPTPLRLGIVLG